MKKYLLTGVSDDNWSLLKAACAYNRITVKTFFLDSINLAVAEFTRTDFYKDIVKIHLDDEV
ncbi:MAG: hypothetical protein KAW52_04980 [candidate division Zixibacteria bacterium]|nr:hypothetical protein [candidate division Zixibacteria bacterium]